MTTNYNGKVVEETDDYYVVLEQMPNMRAFRRVQYYKNNTNTASKAAETPAPTYSARDIQVGGQHYKNKAMQPWDIIDAWGLDFYEGNVLKYLLRAKFKNGVEDLKKARHYLDKKIEDADAS